MVRPSQPPASSRIEPESPLQDSVATQEADPTTLSIAREEYGGDDMKGRGGFLPSSGDGSCAPSALIDRGVIGEGGMGVVHQVYEPALGRVVAAKVLRPERVDGRLDSFLREARVLSRLEHPNIVPLYALGRNRDGQLERFVMKLVEGQSLGERIDDRQGETLDPSELTTFLRSFSQICDALSFAHSKGVIHRDLKPDNIMLGRFGEVYLMDWGIAVVRGERSPGADRVVGTPAYMAPEHLYGKDDWIDERTDVFGLGAVLYEFLTGCPPYSPKEGVEIMSQVRAGIIEPPEERAPEAKIPAALSDIVMRALHKDPARRHPTPAMLKAAVERFIESGAWAQRIIIEESAVVCSEGDIGDCAFLIESGSFVVFKDYDGEQTEIGRLHHGDFFGELSLITGEPRSATVVADSEAVLLKLTRDVFIRTVPSGSWLDRMVHSLSARFMTRDLYLRALRTRCPVQSSGDQAGCLSAWSVAQPQAQKRKRPDSREVVRRRGRSRRRR